MHSDVPYVRDSAIEALSHCGRPALPVLRRMLKDETLADWHDRIIKTLGTVEGKASGPELMDIVISEAAFWHQKALSLHEGWWNGTGLPWNEVKSLRNHYEMLYSSLTTLRAIKYQGNLQAVIDLRDFWRSFPQLGDQDGQSQMVEASDNVLHQTNEAK
jgi:hypothetical protein